VRQLKRGGKGNAMTDKPLAAAGLISYRCMGNFGWIMIGATDHDDAFREALRSCREAKRDTLEVWQDGKYVKVYPRCIAPWWW
jgi:hypothetical protein